MAETTTPMGRTARLLDSYLAGMEARSELVPGGRTLLLKMFASGQGSPEQALSALIAHLDGPGKRFLSPEAPARSEAPQRAALKRLEAGGYLRKGAADQLYSRWAAALATIEDDESAVNELARRAVDAVEPDDLAMSHRPGLDHRGLKVRTVLAALEGHLRPGLDLDQIAARWGREFGHLAPAAVARMVVGRLKIPAHAEDLTRDGQPVEIVGDLRELTGGPAPGAADMESDLRSHVQYW